MATAAWALSLGVAGCASQEVARKFVDTTECPKGNVVVQRLDPPPAWLCAPEPDEHRPRPIKVKGDGCRLGRIFVASGCGDHRLYECDLAVGHGNATAKSCVRTRKARGQTSMMCSSLAPALAQNERFQFAQHQVRGLAQEVERQQLEAAERHVLHEHDPAITERS
jgi:hypothetical protein